MAKAPVGGVSFAVTTLLLALSPAGAAESRPGGACPGGDAGITLPRGFCATVFADNLGHARHMTVTPEGVVYINTWSGRYYGNAKPPAGGFLVALFDSNGDGKADVVKRFGETPAGGGRGGTGIAIHEGGLYAEEGDKIVRYELSAADIAPDAKKKTIVSGLPLTGDHPMHPFIIDAQGNLYVDSASATNSCQAQNRMLESPGLQPCKELETRGGVWRYYAKDENQKFSPAERYATGIRNGEGFAIDGERIYVAQHGRDQLFENWPKLYTQEQGAELPAEEVLLLERGADYGWPECYYDGAQKKLALAPEYGGDGGKAVGVCAEKRGPFAAFPAHWAPNALALYRGRQFPSAYEGGLFIAFHGSWNRAPAPQGGYSVVFQPIADGKPKGDFVVFADGFAGGPKHPGSAAHRPSGVAVGPDGSLYVSDDVRGRIWRITFNGDVASTGVEAAPPAPEAIAQSPQAPPPEGVDPEAGKSEGRQTPLPPGVTDAEVARGERIFNGHEAGGNCAGCHGANGKGTPLAPDLTRGKWLWSDGTIASLKAIITKGVQEPKEFRGPMPARGGPQLSDADVAATAAYVWSISREKVR